MRRVVVAPHMRCNASCRHCCVASHPRDTRYLEDTDVRRIVEEASDSSDIEVISFTGGEALLRWDFMLSLIATAYAAGKKTTIVSNGFWGVTESLAEQRLQALRDAGLTLLTLSVDAFHMPYIPLARIKNILKARCSVPSPQIDLNMCESRTHKAADIIEELGELAKDLRIGRFSVTPVGSAASMPEDEIEYRATSTDNLRCPGQTLLFSGDDNVYPCCSTGVMNSALSLGRASQLSVSEARRRVEHNLVFYILTHEGMSWFVERFKELGIPEYQDAFPVVDPCHLCCRIFSSEENLKKILPALQSYREAYLHSHKETVS